MATLYSNLKYFRYADQLGSIKYRSFKAFWLSEESSERTSKIGPTYKYRHHCIAHNKSLKTMEQLRFNPKHGRFV